MSGDATVSAAAVRSGNFDAMSLCSMTSVSVAVAPIVAPPPSTEIVERSLIVVRSTMTSGNGRPAPWTQSFRMPPMRSLPPPTTFVARLEFYLRRSTACATVVASYSSKALIFFLPPSRP